LKTTIFNHSAAAVSSARLFPTASRRCRGLYNTAAALVVFATVHCAASDAVWMRVTAYCPCKVCCGPRACGITATGRRAVGAIAAVDPRRIKLGRMVNVPGAGWLAAEDTGRDIVGNRVDVLLPTHAEARRWGVRWLPVRVATRAAVAEEERARREEALLDELIAAGRRLAAGTYRRADGTLMLAGSEAE
jgi:3D (Asp-Asp-Asp) domain-containing protein